MFEASIKLLKMLKSPSKLTVWICGTNHHTMLHTKFQIVHINSFEVTAA